MRRRRPAARGLGPFPPLTAVFTRKAWLSFCYLVVGTVVGGAALALALVVSAVAVTVVGLPLLPAGLSAARYLGRVQVTLTGWLCGAHIETAPLRIRPGVSGWLASVPGSLDSWRALGYVLVKVPVAVAGLVAVAVWLAAFGAVLYPAWLTVWRDSGARGAGLRFGHSLLNTWPEALTVCAVGVVAVFVLVWPVVAVAQADRWLTGALLGTRAGDREPDDATMARCR